MRQPRLGAAVGPDQPGRGVGELQPGLLAGLVHGGQRGPGEAVGVALDPEQGQAGRGAAHHQDQVGRVAVEDEGLVAVERPAVARRGRGQGDAVGVPPTRVLGEGQGGDGLAGGDPGSRYSCCALVAGGEDGVGGQGHGGEERGAEQGGAHLLEHHDELHIGEAGAAELLGDGERLQAQLLGHLGPDRRVVALGGLHQPADLGLGRLVLEEAPDRLAELVLLLAEGEIHRVLHPLGRPTPGRDARLSTGFVYQNRIDDDQQAEASNYTPTRQVSVRSGRRQTSDRGRPRRPTGLLGESAPGSASPVAAPGPTALDPPGGPPMTATIIDYQDTAVEVHRLVVGPMDNNVYIVRCRSTGESVLIDAANEHDKLLELCRALDVRQVVETHGHWDHIQAVEAVRDAGIDVAVTRADAGMLPSYDQILEDRSVLEVGRLRIATIATPGHTPGSMCFAVEGTPLLFTGDTLFPGRPGQHLVRPLRLPHHHRLHRGPAVRRVRCRHHGPARPRGRHHHRHRVPPSRGVDRPGLVRAGRIRRWPDR